MGPAPGRSAPERCFNLADLFEIASDTVPTRLALVAGPVRLTYAELDRRANRFAHLVIDSGITPGAHVGILAYNRSEWAEAMLGSFKARAVPVNLNYRYVATELRSVIEDADLEVLVHESALSGLADDALRGARTSQPLCRLVLDDDREEAAESRTRGGSRSYEDAMGVASDRRDFGPRSPDDLYILYTGGTTGTPKGVLWRQEDIFFAAMGGGGRGMDPITSPGELAGRIDTDESGRMVMLAVAPLMHGNAQWMMWNAWMMGGTAVLYAERRYNADSLLQLAAEERTVSIGLVGDAMARPLARAAASARPGTYDLSHLRIIGSGGAMLSGTVKDELAAVLPDVVVTDRFGASESGAHGAVETGASGPRFVMSADTTVLDDDLRPLAPGDGRIGRLARSGRIPLGYYKDPEKSASTFPVDTEGVRWSVPGDLASIEADGTITVHGRGSATINSGGEKIFPEEVEAAIKSHPAVGDAIVVGIEDDQFGQQVAVVVHSLDDALPPTLADLQIHCRTLIAGYKLPRRLLLVDEIPLTAAGKPDGKAAQALFGRSP
ncbi:MAG: AMP-binding protein [Acidimicrobiales bacterium]